MPSERSEPIAPQASSPQGLSSQGRRRTVESSTMSSLSEKTATERSERLIGRSIVAGSG
jgi:hypothetical protein